MNPKRFALMTALAVSLVTIESRAGVVIIGALSNFDCHNETPEVCDEFEIELEGPHVEDCTGTWGNYNYGPGKIAPMAGNIGIRVNYLKAGHTTAIGAVEHFGVHFTATAPAISNKTFRWKHNGNIVTSGNGTAPVPIPSVVITTTGIGTTVTETIENESPNQVIWVKRLHAVVAGTVTLADLMTDSTIVQSATELETELSMLDVGETMVNDENVAPEDTIQSFILVVETYADIPTWNPSTQDYDHAPGALISTSMNATAVQVPTCEAFPVITLQPTSTSAPLDGQANFQTLATNPPAGGQMNYQWMHDGVPLRGEDSADLNIDPILPESAGQYTCDITNDCGQVTTNAATLTIQPCMGDVAPAGGNQTVNIDDLLAVINSWGPCANPGNCPADIAPSGGNDLVNIDDLLGVINAWGPCN